jgi:hypothetical protein
VLPVGLFAGPDPFKDGLLAIGNSLDKSTIVDLQIDDQALNDNGVVAFLATLADGRQVIYRADPLEVPEPNMLTLVTLLGLGLLVSRRRLV